MAASDLRKLIMSGDVWFHLLAKIRTSTWWLTAARRKALSMIGQNLERHKQKMDRGLIRELPCQGEGFWGW